jgi:hypothetical protein
MNALARAPQRPFTFPQKILDPQRSSGWRSRPVVPALGGFLVGVVLTLTSLAVLAPRPAAVKPDPGASELAVTMDDSYLSTLVGRGLNAALPTDVSGAKVHVAADGTVDVSADVDMLIGTGQLEATAQVSVFGGHVVVHTSNAQLGGLALPDVVTGAIDNNVNQQLAQAVDGLRGKGLKYRLAGMTASEGHLTLLLTEG